MHKFLFPGAVDVDKTIERIERIEQKMGVNLTFQCFVSRPHVFYQEFLIFDDCLFPLADYKTKPYPVSRIIPETAKLGDETGKVIFLSYLCALKLLRNEASNNGRTTDRKIEKQGDAN